MPPKSSAEISRVDHAAINGDREKGAVGQSGGLASLRVADDRCSSAFHGTAQGWQPSSLEPAMSFIGLADTAKVAAIGAIVAAEVTIGYGLLVFGGTCLAGMAAVLLGVFSVALFGFVLSKEPPACGCLGVVRVFESNRAEALFGLGRNLVFMGALVWTLGATVKEQPQ